MKRLGSLLKKTALSIEVLFFLAVLATSGPIGCRTSRHTSNSQLRQIDDTLDAQLPAGTSRSRVTVYLNSQGYTIENTNDPHAMVAIVRRVDTETLRPVTARVTFHFDASDNLTTYELAVAPGSSSQP